LEETYNFEDALLIGSLLISLINRSDRVKIACLAQLVNVIAPIMTSDLGAWRQTIFYPFLHASMLGRGTALRAAVTCPSYNTVNVENVPVLHCAAVENEENATLTLFLVNKDLEENLEVSCDLCQWANYRILRQTVLNHDDLKAENTEDAPDRVIPRDGRFASFDAGRLTLTLEKHSWNVVVLVIA
jgi:alpha-N-arabinofuranosidase